ncbi:MAG: 1,4-alpha-glucan branching protein GlgB [Firmicutes bacterium]|nr:1,4-alpha-glucan branching protein GlgB [Bacillota bacterium]
MVHNAKKKFWDGQMTNAYDYFGAHFEEGDKDRKCTFRVWAPNAKEVYLVGEFNGWQDTLMNWDDGIWSIEISGVKEYQCYKYVIVTYDGKKLYKCDPYAFHAETITANNSKVVDLKKLKWTDDEWMESKSESYNKPMNIYEVHIGSWRKYPDGQNFSYRKFADEITEYLVDMAYTHIELMGIAEHPFDGSWGYQVTGYYAPTSRYGSPEDFAYLVDKLHNAGIGIILDWVPGHFPKDEHGLFEFDGGPLYEPNDPLKKEHLEWGTRCFDYSRGEVLSFLISNALYWLDVFHIDGLRVDAVASMLYLDYNREHYRPNAGGGRESDEAVEFLKRLNTQVFSRHPHALMIAEESTAWAGVTKPVHMGGLGFNYKWNMGWMNDTLRYVAEDPMHRSYHHDKITFSMVYAFTENFILPISHDEVVHGKGSLVNKMPGDLEGKLAGWRNYLMYMFSHPGKKITFMGTEFAQFSEWNYSKELDWGLLSLPKHKNAQHFMKVLNRLYRNNKEFYEIENSWDGFRWITTDDRAGNVVAFERKSGEDEIIVCIFNFSGSTWKNYRLGCSRGEYEIMLESSRDLIEGYTTKKTKTLKTEQIESHSFTDSLMLDIKPMSGLFLKRKK